MPKRVARARDDGHVHARDDDDEMLLLDAKGPLRVSQSQSALGASPASKAKAKAAETDGSATEDDSDGEAGNTKPSGAADAPRAGKREQNPLPTPARSISPEIDPARAPGRIIGATHPLDDFRVNIARGDMVSKAVEDLGVVITEIVMRPFASRRQAELVECLETMRNTCLKVCWCIIFSLQLI